MIVDPVGGSEDPTIVLERWVSTYFALKSNQHWKYDKHYNSSGYCELGSAIRIRIWLMLMLVAYSWQYQEAINM